MENPHIWAESSKWNLWQYSNRYLSQARGAGVLRKNLTGVLGSGYLDRYPLAKEILVETIPLAKEAFLIMSPFLHDFKEFQPKYSLYKRNFPQTDANLAPKYQFLRVFIKNIPLAKDFGRKIYPRIRALARYFTSAFASVKYLSQRPHPRAKTWHKIWMTGLNPTNKCPPPPCPRSHIK